ncbi:hypothetical protein [Gordonia sp. DT101]|uniref:hypothetical protein n=1 Tax=Gordonia sp. DT101 TaxID=3416545 RepID=UPI003CFB9555
MGTPPNLNDETVSTGAVVEELRGRLQHGLADDILWGTPKGQVLQGYSPLNSIHRQMMPARVAPASNFEVVQTIAPAPV